MKCEKRPLLYLLVSQSWWWNGVSESSLICFRQNQVIRHQPPDKPCNRTDPARTVFWEWVRELLPHKKKTKPCDTRTFNFCLQRACLFRAHLVKSFISVLSCVCRLKRQIKPELYRIQESQSQWYDVPLTVFITWICRKLFWRAVKFTVEGIFKPIAPELVCPHPSHSWAAHKEEGIQSCATGLFLCAAFPAQSGTE